MKWLERYTDHAYALLRIVSGFLFSFHGMQKIFGILSDHDIPLWSQVWIGGIIELAGGLAIMIGLQTRFAAFICSGTMAVAYAQFHWKFQFDSGFFPVMNGGELAAVYCFLFLFIASRGAGRWSLDKAN
ncbi:MAG: DoxX family protein [Candidatus Zixiibacteriota bacterium]